METIVLNSTAVCNTLECDNSKAVEKIKLELAVKHELTLAFMILGEGGLAGLTNVKTPAHLP